MAGRITTNLAPHQPITSTGIVVDDSVAIVNAYGQPLRYLASETIIDLLAEFVDDEGRHYYQVGPDEFVMKKVVVLERTLWLATRQAGAELVNLGAENINQIWWGMPNGCEPAALLEGLHLKQVVPELDYLAFLKQMPRAADFNPYHGFGGEPDQDVSGHFEAIFPAPLIKWATNYTRVTDISGMQAGNLWHVLKRKNPIVAYVTVGFERPEWGEYTFGQALSNNHAVLVDGYFGANFLHVSDPIDGQYWLSLNRFRRGYDARLWAVEVG